MLAWIWFAVLTAVGVGISVYSGKVDDPTAEGNAQMLAHLVLFISLTASGSVTVSPVYHFLHDFIPDQGTDLHGITVFVLMGLYCCAYIFVLPFVTMCLASNSKKEPSEPF